MVIADDRSISLINGEKLQEKRKELAESINPYRLLSMSQIKSMLDDLDWDEITKHYRWDEPSSYTHTVDALLECLIQKPNKYIKSFILALQDSNQHHAVNILYEPGTQLKHN